MNFNKANWQDIKAKLKNTDWAPMKELAKESPIAAHSWFIDTIIPILEEFVPQKGIKGSKWRSKEFKKRKSLLRKLGKIRKKISSASSVSKLARLIQDKAELERNLKYQYTTTNFVEENQVVSNMKKNPKAFYSFAKSRQKTRAKIGPFLDPITNIPNPDPDFTA